MPSQLAARWLPAAIRDVANRALGASIVYRGPFSSWEAACRVTGGYDQSAILDRVVTATRHVLQGAADYEQDGVTRCGTPPASHALAGLLLAAGANGGHLSVLDFGGGLASHYLRWKPLLAHLPARHWSVVEQENFVAAGCEVFAADQEVSFHASIGDVCRRPNAVLLSGVLHLLHDPYSVLSELSRLGSSAIVIDRTPYSEDGVERIVAQFVPNRLGRASYPAWMLSRDRVHATMSRHYELIQDFDTLDHPMRVGSHAAPYRGSIWVRTQ